MGGDGVVVFPARIDLTNVDDVRRDLNTALDAPGVQRMIIDLAAVSFVDSLCVGLFVYARNRCLALEVSLVLRNSPPMARRLLAISALDALFTFEAV